MQNETTPQWLLEQGFSESFAQRFWKKVNKTESCWVWTAHKNRDGHGQLSRGGKDAAHKKEYAHRASWMLHHGRIPDGKLVLHKCSGGGNAWCVNPDHLYIGTNMQNTADMIQNGRANYSKMALGEAVGNSKLKSFQIPEIREKINCGYSLRKLGRMFGVSATAIKDIKIGRTWSHIK